MGKKKTKDKIITAPEAVVEETKPAPRPVARKTKTEPTASDVVASGADVIGAENMPEEREAEQFVPRGGDSLVPLLHRLLDTVNTKTAIPAIAESCSCGATVTISEAMPEADRKRIHNAWLRRHKPCSAAVVDDAAE